MAGKEEVKEEVKEVVKAVAKTATVKAKETKSLLLYFSL